MDSKTVIGKVETESVLKEGATSWNAWRDSNDLANVDFSKIDLTNQDFTGYDFSGLDLANSDFSQSELSHAKFISCNLKNAKFQNSGLENVNFIAARLIQADLTKAKITNANFLTAELSKVNFSFVDFTGLSLRGMNFEQSCLHRANLQHQDLAGISFNGADLSGADLTETSLENCDFQEANLSSAILRLARLTGANFRKANLTGVDLSSQNLSNLNFKQAKLNNCDLRNSIISNSNLEKANLTNTKLFNIDTRGWKIRDLVCSVAFWDEKGEVKSKYKAREFERLYAAPVSVTLRYEGYISPYEISTLPLMVEHLEARFWGIKLRLKNIQDTEGASVVNLVVQDTGGFNVSLLEEEMKEEVSHLLAAQRALREDTTRLKQLRESLAQVKNQFWPQLLELAAETVSGKMHMLTVLLLDLTGFSRWHGDELVEKLNLFRGLVKPILNRWNAGYPNMEGDSLRATFNNASVAVTCACTINNVLHAAGLPCRIGLDLGEVVLQHNEITEITDISGSAVNFAARLEASSEPGEVLISERVWHYIKRQESVFKVMPKQIKLSKDVGSLQAGDTIQCYSVNLKKPMV